MSFYTALTGLNGSQADIAATSNNIANVGTTGFKRSRAEFGDIFATSPLQNSSSSIGSGSILKGVKQQFTQGNIAASLNALDLAISGQGFFALKPSLTSSQVVYTRNGSFNVDNNRNVVDSTGQFLLTYPVNDDGSVTSKDIADTVPLQLPVTSGEPKATSNIDLAVNLDAGSPVIADNPKFADGYQFNPNDPDTFTNSTSLTIFDDLGNPTIATVYFIKTKASDAVDPTNKYDTRLVIDGVIVSPDLVPAVDDTGRSLFIDRFGRETIVSSIPDDNYFAEGKGSPLYRLDDLNQKVPSQPARLTGAPSSFDFGEEGNKLIEITNDPMKYKATREAGNNESSIFWGKDFLLVNVDDGDVPVSIDLRPGFYNATQLAAEVERAINDAYGDDKKLQVQSNVDDTLTIDLFNLNADGSFSGLSTPVSVDLLQSTFVSTQQNIDVTGASPDFTREEFLAHAQVRINDALNSYVITDGNALGVENQLFGRASTSALTGVFEHTEIIDFNHYASTNTNGTGATATALHLAHAYNGKIPTLDVYTEKATLAGAIQYTSSNNTLSITVPNSDIGKYEAGEVVRLAGTFASDTFDSLLNGREFTIFNVDTGNNALKITLAGQSFSDSDFTLGNGSGYTEAHVLSNKSNNVEAFFEGADLQPHGSVESFNSKKIVLRETATSRHTYKHGDVRDGSNNAVGIFGNFVAEGLGRSGGSVVDSLEKLGFQNSSNASTVTNSTVWVDEKKPPITIGYDSVNQRFQFGVNHTAIGPGTDSNFRAFKISGNSSATSTNNLGIQDSASAKQEAISSTAIIYGDSFVADGGELQLNAKRFGVTVDYNSDTGTFVFGSGTTGETIAANGALGVATEQKASNIQVGRYSISATDGSVVNTDFDTASRALASGVNDVMGVGQNKTDVRFEAGRGLASQPARATGAPATEALSEVFNLSSTGGANIFNVSVNGISGIIEVPPGNYVGSTLSSELEKRINQIVDGETGQVVGGVTVQYQAATNNFVFETATTGTESTIKVKGSARLGLDDVPLGVGTVPEITNLVQATTAAGVPLFVNAAGDIVESPPANLVTDYFPLFLDEGELTFDKTGAIVSPLNKVHYEQQAAGFSISLDVDYSASTQLAQPFAVNNLVQNGFTSGRLDGLDIDATGLLRANYTNGENKPLGKIVLANFNNQNGLKQIGNATFVETATSGSPTFGEAGAEGFGSVQSGSLERSNVDITEELVNLITAQRNFQASSKAIETSTQLTQTIINIRS
ncbi:MAG: flagellar hook-basal body protein [Rhodospirillaceae bacterium]|nr:flagellar hook-basal body protein [Rhodospirillaceae bacterium]|tara:strand:- start:2180 stop:5941 length:3762 start_codon:yes stop_codon:yes gene_type:complete